MFSHNFTNQFNVSLDDKNRFHFPAEFRNKLKKSDELVITQGLDKCLFIFVKNDFAAICKKQFDNPELTEKVGIRKLRRVLFGTAAERKLDKQGRLLLPDPLKKLVNIEKQMIIVGVGYRMEIWSSENWKKEEESNINIADIIENL